MKYIILILLAALLCLTGCSAEEKTMYHQIPQEEAKQMADQWFRFRSWRSQCSQQDKRRSQRLTPFFYFLP